MEYVFSLVFKSHTIVTPANDRAQPQQYVVPKSECKLSRQIRDDILLICAMAIVIVCFKYHTDSESRD